MYKLFDKTMEILFPGALIGILCFAFLTFVLNDQNGKQTNGKLLFSVILSVIVFLTSIPIKILWDLKKKLPA